MVSDGANDSNLAGAIISVTATNDAPVMTVDPAAAYVENAAAVVLAPLAALSDADDTELNGALVTITAGSFPGDGDILSVGGATSNTVNGITFVWMPAQHALVFTGASSVANYQDAAAAGSVPVEQRQSHRLQPQPAANPDVGRDRQRVRDHRNDDDRYRRRERRA